MDKKEINKDISVLHLVCYLDNKTDKLLWIEQYENNSENIQTNTNKYKHDYNDKIIKTEELINQMDADYEYYAQELKALRSIIKNKEKRNAELFVMCNKYRKVLKDIEKYLKKQDTSRTSLFNIFAIEQEICNIINKVEDNNMPAMDRESKSNIPLETLQYINNLKNENKKLEAENDKYYKILKDIEKISHYGTFKCVDCGGFDCRTCTKEQFEIILKIIKETKDDNE